MLSFFTLDNYLLFRYTTSILLFKEETVRYKKDYSGVFETSPQTEANQRYRIKFRDKVRLANKLARRGKPQKPPTPEQRIRLNIWHRRKSLERKPLQQRSWWISLSEEHRQLFLTEYDLEKQTIHEFRAYLKSLQKPLKTGLDVEKVKDIKQGLKNGIPGIPDSRVGGYLAKKYGVSRQTINHIKQGKTWKDV